MSQENVKVILQGVEAVNRRDADAWVAIFSPSVEWEESGDAFPGLRGVHRGWAGVRKWFEEAILEPWERLHLQVEEISEASGGRVFGEYLFTATGRASGVETRLRFWSVFRVAGGKVTRRQIFWTREEALEAAGLSE